MTTQVQCDECEQWSPFHSPDCAEGRLEEWLNSLTTEEWERQMELYWDHMDQFGPAAQSRFVFFGFGGDDNG